MEALLQAPYIQFQINSDFFRNCFESVSNKISQKRPGKHSNNMIFVGMHTVEARYMLGHQLGLHAAGPFAATLKEAKTVQELTTFPEVSEVIDAWNEATEKVEKRFDKMLSADLRSEAPLKLPIENNTVIAAVAFLVNHEAYHIGQLAHLRKHYGMGPMRYNPMGV